MARKTTKKTGKRAATKKATTAKLRDLYDKSYRDWWDTQAWRMRTACRILRAAGIQPPKAACPKDDPEGAKAFFTELHRMMGLKEHMPVERPPDDKHPEELRAADNAGLPLLTNEEYKAKIERWADREAERRAEKVRGSKTVTQEENKIGPPTTALQWANQIAKVKGKKTREKWVKAKRWLEGKMGLKLIPVGDNKRKYWLCRDTLLQKIPNYSEMVREIEEAEKKTGHGTDTERTGNSQ